MTIQFKPPKYDKTTQKQKQQQNKHTASKYETFQTDKDDIDKEKQKK